ncbi:MAG: hypothetical protein AAF495_19415 [Pseudomonadota bacterium]
MRVFPAVGLSALLVLLGACSGGSYTSSAYYSDCESRGLAPGSSSYNRCVKDLRGRELIDFSFTRGKSYRSR